TRFSRDWSSDVCSSDLLWGMSQERMYEAMQRPTTIVAIDPPPEVLVYTPEHAPDSLSMLLRAGTIELRDPLPHELVPGPKRAQKIGRASSRERVWLRND